MYMYMYIQGVHMQRHVTVAVHVVLTHNRVHLVIRESVDSLCRDDADMPMPPYIRKACNRPNAAFVSLFR